jgi:hypothetical protein
MGYDEPTRPTGVREPASPADPGRLPRLLPALVDNAPSLVGEVAPSSLVDRRVTEQNAVQLLNPDNERGVHLATLVEREGGDVLGMACRPFAGLHWS